MNRNTTLALVIVFGLLLIYVLLIQRPKDEATANATPTIAPTPSRVWNFDPQQVTGFGIVEIASGRSVTVTHKPEGGWQVTSPEDRPADEGQITTLLSQLAGLSVSTLITNPAELSAFGVLAPSYTLGVQFADGTRLQVSVGDKTPTDTGYYVLRDGETDVLVVGTGIFANVTQLLDTPPYFIPTPTPTIEPALDLTVLPAVTPTP